MGFGILFFGKTLGFFTQIYLKTEVIILCQLQPYEYGDHEQ